LVVESLDGRGGREEATLRPEEKMKTWAQRFKSLLMVAFSMGAIVTSLLASEELIHAREVIETRS
jgi:hypothetical protein